MTWRHSRTNIRNESDFRLVNSRYEKVTPRPDQGHRGRRPRRRQPEESEARTVKESQEIGAMNNGTFFGRRPNLPNLRVMAFPHLQQLLTHQSHQIPDRCLEQILDGKFQQQISESCSFHKQEAAQPLVMDADIEPTPGRPILADEIVSDDDRLSEDILPLDDEDDLWPDSSESTPWTTKKYLRAIGYTCMFSYCIVVASGFLVSSVGLLLPALQKFTGVSANTVVWILPGEGLGLLIALPFSGILFEQFKKSDADAPVGCRVFSLTKIVAIALFVMAICLFLLILIPVFVISLFLFVVVGFCAAFVEVGSHLALAWIWREKVGLFMQILACLPAVGSFIFSIFLCVLFGRIDSTSRTVLVLGYVLTGVALLFPVVILAFLPVPTHSEQEPAATSISETLKDMFCDCKELLTFPTLIYAVVGVSKALIVGVVSAFGAVLFHLAVFRELGSGSTLAGLLITFWACFGLSRIIGIFVRTLLPPTIVALACAIGTFVAFLEMMILGRYLWGLWVGAVLFGVFGANLSASEIAIPQTAGVGLNSLSMTIVSVGSSFGEVIVPALVGMFGVKSLIFVLGVLALLLLGSLILLVVLANIHKKRSSNAEEASFEGLPDESDDDVVVLDDGM